MDDTMEFYSANFPWYNRWLIIVAVHGINHGVYHGVSRESWCVPWRFMVYDVAFQVLGRGRHHGGSCMSIDHTVIYVVERWMVYVVHGLTYGSSWSLCMETHGS